MEPSWVETSIVAPAGSSPVWQGLIGGVMIILMNTIGALLVLVWRRRWNTFDKEVVPDAYARRGP
jgi:hypothetical protein